MAYEGYRGKVKAVDLTGTDIETWSKNKLIELYEGKKQFKLGKRHTNYFQALMDLHSNKFSQLVNGEVSWEDVFIGTLYEFTDMEEVGVHDFFQKTLNNDGSVSFIIGYNGSGFHYTEALPQMVVPTAIDYDKDWTE